MPSRYPPEFRRKVLDLIAARDCTKPGGDSNLMAAGWPTLVFDATFAERWIRTSSTVRTGSRSR